jgi:outer membrane protein assembly factor BamA
VALASALPGLVLGAAPPLPGPGSAEVTRAAEGGRPLVSDVIIQTAFHVPTEEIRNLIKTRPGLPYDAQTVQDDVRTLYATGKFADVSCDKKDDLNGRAVVFFYVRPCLSKIERVEYRGNHHLSKDELDEVISVRKGQWLAPGTNKAACGNIVARYKEKGRLFARCELLAGAGWRDKEVIFQITEGPKVRVKDIRITGNAVCPAPSTTVPPWMVTAPCRMHESLEAICTAQAGEYYDQRKIDTDLARIRMWLGSQGRDVQVQVIPICSKDSPGLVALRYEVKEGPPTCADEIKIVGTERTTQEYHIFRTIPQYPSAWPPDLGPTFPTALPQGPIERVTFRGVTPLPPPRFRLLCTEAGDLQAELEAIMRDLGIQPGAPFSSCANAIARQRILARYHNLGYNSARCVVKVAGNELIFHIDEGGRCPIRDVRFTGNTLASSDVLLAHINTNLGKVQGLVGSFFKPKDFDAATNELANYYRGLGYRDVRIARERVYRYDGVTISFQIEEGPRYRILDEPTLVGMPEVPIEELQRMLKIKKGEYFDQDKVNWDVALIESYLGSQSHDARVTAMPIQWTNPTGTMSLHYVVEQARPQR